MIFPSCRPKVSLPVKVTVLLVACQVRLREFPLPLETGQVEHPVRDDAREELAVPGR